MYLYACMRVRVCVFHCLLLLLCLLPHLLPDRLSVTGEISALLFAQAVERTVAQLRVACHTCAVPRMLMSVDTVCRSAAPNNDKHIQTHTDTE